MFMIWEGFSSTTAVIINWLGFGSAKNMIRPKSWDEYGGIAGAWGRRPEQQLKKMKIEITSEWEMEKMEKWKIEMEKIEKREN